MAERSIAELENAQYSSPETEAVPSNDEQGPSEQPQIDVEAMMIACQESDLQVLYEMYDDLSTDEEGADREQAFRQGCRAYIEKNREQSAGNDDPETIASHDVLFTSVALRNARIRQVLIENLPDSLNLASDKLIQSLVFIISQNILKTQKEPEGSALQAVESPKKEDVLKSIASLPEITLVDSLPNDMLALRNEDGKISLSTDQISKPETTFLKLAEEIESRLGGQFGDGGSSEQHTKVGTEAYYAEKGITREDLIRYKKFPQKERYAIASVYQACLKDPKSGSFENIKGEFYKMLREEPSSYKIDIGIARSHQTDLDKYYKIWQELVDSNFNPDDIEAGSEADGGGDSVDSSSGESETQGSGGSAEHGKEGGAAKEAGTRAGGKSNEPKNVYQAFVELLNAANSDLLNELNLPGKIVDDISNLKSAA